MQLPDLEQGVTILDSWMPLMPCWKSGQLPKALSSFLGSMHRPSIFAASCTESQVALNPRRLFLVSSASLCVPPSKLFDPALNIPFHPGALLLTVDPCKHHERILLPATGLHASGKHLSTGPVLPRGAALVGEQDLERAAERRCLSRVATGGGECEAACQMGH